MNSPLKNDLYIKALLRQPTERTPIWVMRQAGRYLPEYRELRAEAGSFMNLCTNPPLACEVTMQPLRRFQLDAAILFSDILTIPDAMGLGLYLQPLQNNTTGMVWPSYERCNPLTIFSRYCKENSRNMSGASTPPQVSKICTACAPLSICALR